MTAANEFTPQGRRPTAGRLVRAAALAACASTAQAQQPAAPAAPARAASAPATLERVQISGERQSDETRARRYGTASKIVVGREEIERFGDSTVGELLKRLPGVTVQGAPGRGGAIRMRGLGSGYTQILLDGERLPPGFSLDTLDPEQIERIEILRAPTAETGAQAIAGTINIVTREGLRRRSDDLRLSLGAEDGRLSPGVSWTRNDVAGPWTVNFSLTAFRVDRENDGRTRTLDTRLADGAVTLDQTDHTTSRYRLDGVHLSSRLQWRGGADSVTLKPFVMLHDSRSDWQTERRRSQPTPDPQSPGLISPAFDNARGTTDSRFSLGRISADWNRTLADGAKLEWRGTLGAWQSRSLEARRQFSGGAASLDGDERSEVDERWFSLKGKWSRVLDNDHQLVAGVDWARNWRDDRATAVQSLPARPVVDERQQASGMGYALYAQDEWELSPQWAVHLGLRGEGSEMRGESAGQPAQTNRHFVWTPLAHAVWKFAPKSRDQLRMSLTRSYRAPRLNQLIGRSNPLRPNSPTSPDRVGNPNLQPETALGLDLAVERYLEGGGLLSASVFHRDISDLIRSRTAFENGRWVSQVQNVGDAITQGIELEARFRLSDVWPQAIPLDVRANASLFRSRVKGVAGPDNRLDQQPDGTLNLGADYRFRGTPLAIGGSLNWTPAYDTRLSNTQTALQGRKRLFDAYAVWHFDKSTRLRLSATNLAPLDYVIGSGITVQDAGGLPLYEESSLTTARSSVKWQLRLEMKL